jgi:hypothetical protein
VHLLANTGEQAITLNYDLLRVTLYFSDGTTLVAEATSVVLQQPNGSVDFASP